MKNAQSDSSQNAFQLKGSMQTVTMLHLLQASGDAFATQLEALVKTTSHFFKNAPVIIDLERVVDNYDSIDFGRIKAELQRHGIIPVGVRNGNELQLKAAIAAGMGVLSASKSEPTPKSQSASTKNSTSKIITQPVRSGQQVYAQNGDLIVLASVSAGAELLADGHIHVYGTLRGRAMAGVTGNIHARIFCHKLAAELISVAGYYKLHDDIKVPQSNQGIQIFLDEERIVVGSI